MITNSFLFLLFADTEPSQSQTDSRLLTAIISAIAVIVVGILTYVLNKNNFKKTQEHNTETLNETKRQNRKTLEENRRLKRKESIEKVLNEFYMPVNAYLQVTESLFNVLKAGKPDDFRTLTYLLEPSQKYKTDDGEITISLSSSDKEIINEIIEIEKKIEEIIVTKAGLVSDENFMFDYQANETDAKPDMVIGLIPHLITHFRIFRLANDGKITDKVSKYKPYVFPRMLRGELKVKIEKLQNELENLDGNQQND